MEETKKHKILFVCLGNICRSPAAEGIMRDIVEQAGVAHEWEIDSAGTGGWHVGQLPDSRMRRHALDRVLKLDHHCRQIDVNDFYYYDYIIGMDSQNIVDLKELSPTVETDAKIHAMMEWAINKGYYDYVPDPYYEGSQGFELVLNLLDDACHGLFNDLTKTRP